MRYRLVACSVFRREIEYLLKRFPQNDYDVLFLDIAEHVTPSRLRLRLQKEIDSAPDGCSAVLLAYGLCGRAGDGLKAKDIPVIIPRSHDCCGILLGSRIRFRELFFDMPSTPFSSIGYIENGRFSFLDGDMLFDDGFRLLVETYGEDNAKYVWDCMHPKLDGELIPVNFISHPEINSAAAAAQCRAHAEKEGRGFKMLSGSLKLLESLLSGKHSEDEFLILRPGFESHMTGDWDRIIKARPLKR